MSATFLYCREGIYAILPLTVPQLHHRPKHKGGCQGLGADWIASACHTPSLSLSLSRLIRNAASIVGCYTAVGFCGDTAEMSQPLMQLAVLHSQVWDKGWGAGEVCAGEQTGPRGWTLTNCVP